MQEVYEILSNIRPEFDFEESRNFISDGMLDSFDIIVLVSELDKKYGISILGTDILPENFVNVQSIILLIDKYESAK